VLALGVYEEAVLPHDAFDLAHLDELWQAELWGEDDFALATRAAHRRDFIAACEFLELLRAA
jgi:chaperone required for assembly of F1-ATPase